MAAGIVYHNITTASGVTFSLACWVPDTAAPDVGAIPVSLPIKSDGTVADPSGFATQAKQDALKAVIGAITDAAYSDDTGAADATVVAALKAIAAYAAGSYAAPPGIQTEDLSLPMVQTSDQRGVDCLATGPYSATSAADVHTWDMKGFAAIAVQITSAGSNNQLIFETSNDGTNWTTAGAFEAGGDGNPTNTSFTATATRIYVIPKRGRYVKLRVASYGSGTVTAIAIQTLDLAPMMGSQSVRGTQQSGQGLSSTNLFGMAVYALTANPSALGNAVAARVMATSLGQLVVKPQSLPEEEWSQAGLTLTASDQAIVAAGAAGIKRYVDWLVISTGSSWTENTLQISNGSTGIISILLPAGAHVHAIPMPAGLIKTSAATALNAKATGAVTGTCIVAVGGHSGP